MITIDNLNLQLPHGFESRANDIAQQTAQILARYPQTNSMTIDRLNMPTMSIHGGEDNGVIAHRIAQTIHQQINMVSVGVRE